MKIPVFLELQSLIQVQERRARGESGNARERRSMPRPRLVVLGPAPEDEMQPEQARRQHDMDD